MRMLSIGNSSHSGFTLLELLLVLVILGLSAAFVAPRIGGGESRALLSQVREAIAVLNYSRRQAIVTGIPVNANIDTLATDTLSASRETHVNRWKGSDDELTWSSSRDHGDNGATKRISNIIFYPGGGSSGGVFEIPANNRVAIIHVNPITSRIHYTIESSDSPLRSSPRSHPQ